IVQLQHAAGFERDDSSAVKLAKLEALLAKAIGKVNEAIPLLAELVGLPSTGSYAVPDLAPQQRKTRVFETLCAQLAGLAAKQPVLVVLEDAHWLDPSSLELFGLFVDRIQRLPVLLIITHRPGFVGPWQGYPHVTNLILSRLPRAQAQSLVKRLTGGKALPV